MTNEIVEEFAREGWNAFYGPTNDPLWDDFSGPAKQAQISLALQVANNGASPEHGLELAYAQAFADWKVKNEQVAVAARRAAADNRRGLDDRRRGPNDNRRGPNEEWDPKDGRRDLNDPRRDLNDVRGNLDERDDVAARRDNKTNRVDPSTPSRVGGPFSPDDVRVRDDVRAQDDRDRAALVGNARPSAAYPGAAHREATGYPDAGEFDSQTEEGLRRGAPPHAGDVFPTGTDGVKVDPLTREARSVNPSPTGPGSSPPASPVNLPPSVTPQPTTHPTHVEAVPPKTHPVEPNPSKTHKVK